MTTPTTAASTTSITTFQGTSSTKTNAALSLLTSLEEGLKDIALAGATLKSVPNASVDTSIDCELPY
jgi:hypothetical protein